MGELQVRDRFALIDPMIVPSAQAAQQASASLAVIRPTNTRFHWKLKSDQAMQGELASYSETSRQPGFLDQDLADFRPSPYEFFFSFQDADGSHTWRCGDWETHATYFKWRQRYSDSETLRSLSGVYNDDYPNRGMAFGIGNMAKRPKTWQLLGVIRLDQVGQLGLL